MKRFGLTHKLQAESSGILNWLLRIINAERGLKPPIKYGATDEYFDEMIQ